MKKLRLAALIVLFITLMVRLVPLPDWTVRLNGVIMIASAAVLVFTSVRLCIIRKEN